MEEGGRVLVDASCCMLFEASGDSESGYHDTAELDAAAAAEDDAESCSSGGVVVDGSGGGNDDIRDAGVDDDCVERSGGIDGGGGATELEEGVVEQFRRSKAAEVNKTKGCEDSNMKLMGERNTDRLFWEACLAS